MLREKTFVIVLGKRLGALGREWECQGEIYRQKYFQIIFHMCLIFAEEENVCTNASR